MTKTKPLPSAVEVEKSVLNTLISSPANIFTAAQLLTPECFYLPKNGHIWKEIAKRHEKQQPIDVLSVAQGVAKSGSMSFAEASSYLVELGQTSFSFDLTGNVKTIYEKFLSLIHISEPTRPY